MCFSRFHGAALRQRFGTPFLSGFPSNALERIRSHVERKTVRPTETRRPTYTGTQAHVLARRDGSSYRPLDQRVPGSCRFGELEKQRERERRNVQSAIRAPPNLHAHTQGGPAAKRTKNGVAVVVTSFLRSLRHPPIVFVALAVPTTAQLTDSRDENRESYQQRNSAARGRFLCIHGAEPQHSSPLCGFAKK